jgi:UDP-N-acetylmuramate dehydrogenase
MLMATRQSLELIDRLPAVRGRLSAGAPLAGVSWFRVGGPAEVSFRPADLADLKAFLAGKPEDIPVTVIGVASNLLIRDGGIPGVTIRLGRGFTSIEARDERVTVGAAALDLNVAKVAANAGIAGLEFLCGVPGTIGGAIRMNAGAYGREIKDVLIEAAFVDATGRDMRLPVEALGYGYRHSSFPKDWICVSATLAGSVGEPQEIAQRMAEIQDQRGTSQPVRSRTGGSTFKNPPGEKAWRLIERAGCRGLIVGDAMVSEQHCNFLINRGGATAGDLERLGEEVRARVERATGVRLEWEIKRIGLPGEGETIGDET